MTTRDELRRLAEAATPGEWEVINGDEWSSAVGTREQGYHHDGSPMYWAIANVNLRRDEGNTNKKYIAAANPQAILALLDELEQCKKDAERYRYLRSKHPICDSQPFIAISTMGGISQWQQESADDQVDAAMAGEKQ